ncbi:hypothetical protein BC937DRAFT_91572 [Endogone sp. FLAS-F59071]|nr:hypothetical protein BC937DRAFT_91572 [Endogone sp. FLAS-F59071]|eukprot:RUS16148.1 hypothetical protein BC937DRAFT_91572 [Endogone sp. FLAS-F59071]
MELTCGAAHFSGIMPISDLPPELLHCIFAYLLPGSQYRPKIGNITGNDLYACSLLCSTWRSVALSLMCGTLRLWLEVAYLERQLRLMAPYHSPYRSSTAHDYISHVRHLSFSFKHTCGEIDIPRATSLALDLLQLISPKQLIELRVTQDERGCTCDISRTAACVATIASMIGNVEYFRMTYWSVDGYVPTLEPILWRLSRSVREIVIENYQGPRPADTVALPAHGVPNMGTAMIKGVDFARLPNVRTAMIEGVDWPTPLLLAGVESWSIRLHSIYIHGCPNFVNDDVMIALARCCPELELLDFDGGSVTDGAMLRLLDACQGLRTLKCCAVAGPTEELLKRCAASKTHRWKAVQFSCCPGVKGEGVEDLSGFEKLDMVWIGEWGKENTVNLAFAKKMSKLAKGLTLCVLGNLFLKKRGVVRLNRITEP